MAKAPSLHARCCGRGVLVATLVVVAGCAGEERRTAGLHHLCDPSMRADVRGLSASDRSLIGSTAQCDPTDVPHVCADAPADCGTDEWRRVRVEVVLDSCTNEYPARVRALEAAMDATAEVYASTFRIKFELGRGSTWPRQRSTGECEWHHLWTEFVDRPTRWADSIVVGLVEATAAPAPGENLPRLAAASSLGRHVLLAWSHASGEFEAMAEVLVHEIAHTFGAWHCNSATSVMRQRPRGTAVLEFDRNSEWVIRQTKWRDVGRGVFGVSEATLERIGRVFSWEHVEARDHPVSRAWEALAERALRAGEMNDAQFYAERQVDVLVRDIRTDGTFVQRVVAWYSARGVRIEPRIR